MEFIVCKTCGKNKPTTDFYSYPRKDQGGKIRTHSSCKKCSYLNSKDRMSKYRENNLEYFSKKSKAFTLKTKLSVIGAYGNVCQCCGECRLEFLSIDHINGGGTKERKLPGMKGIAFYRYLIKNNFPSGHRVLCHNCNFSYGKYGYCPHNNTYEEQNA